MIPAGSRTPKRRRRDVSLWPLALVPLVGGAAIAGVLLVASRVNLPEINPFGGLTRLQIGRQPLAPIRVPPDACPYLNPVHVLAVELNQQWTDALSGRDPWPKFKTELAAELPQLQLAVTRAEPHVPVQIATRFETLARDLRLGSAELPGAASVADVLVPPGTSKSPLAEGVNALADASDLVGNACDYRLAPSNLLVP